MLGILECAVTNHQAVGKDSFGGAFGGFGGAAAEGEHKTALGEDQEQAGCEAEVCVW